MAEIDPMETARQYTNELGVPFCRMAAIIDAAVAEAVEKAAEIADRNFQDSPTLPVCQNIARAIRALKP